MRTLRWAGTVLLAAVMALVTFTRTAAAEVATRASYVVGHCTAAVNYGFQKLQQAADALLLLGGASAIHLQTGAVGDLSEHGGKLMRVKMLKTVSSPHTTWFAANEQEGRDGLYDVDAETARAWIRDGVAEAVGTGASAATKDAAADEDAPRAGVVDPAGLTGEPVNAEGRVKPSSATSSKKK